MTDAVAPIANRMLGPGARVLLGGITGAADKQVTMDTARQRLLVLAGFFLLAFGLVAARTAQLGLQGGASSHDVAAIAPGAGVADGASKLLADFDLAPAVARADIVDRRGEILATSLKSSSLSANPTRVKNPAALAQKLAAIFPQTSVARFESQLASSRRFVWLARKLTPKQKWAVNALGEPALAFHDVEDRIYPHGRLAAHVLGRVGVDGDGLMGVEKYFDDRLTDASHTAEPLALSLDVRVQYALADELAAAMRVQEAKGGAGLVMDVNTGEVLAMVSMPDFDPNLPGDPTDTSGFNRVTQGQYELGSVFKTFTLAGALEQGTVTLASGYDATKPIRAGRFLIRDDHPKARYLTVPEIFAYSSNIGTAQIAVDMGQPAQEAFLRDLGLLSRPSIELQETTAGTAPARWNSVETMTVSYGHGIAISPLQLVSGIASIVNGGRHIPATLVRKSEPWQPGRRVIAEATSRKMRQLMRLAVTKGTGGAADAVGYRVGGKTGTAEKARAGGYDKGAILSSFMGFFPMDDPRYAVFAFLDEPKGRDNPWGFRSAGWTTAPVVRNVVMRVAPILGVAPRREDESLYEKVSLLIEDDEKRAR